MAEDTEIVVYIIATHFGTFYTGISNSIIRRWKEHNNNRSSYLSKFKAKEVVYIEFYNCRKKAYRVECKIKKMGARKYILLKRFEQLN